MADQQEQDNNDNLDNQVQGNANRTIQIKLKLARYSGTDPSIRIQDWISLFEVLSDHCQTERERIRLLMGYLESEALAWYAQDIAPHIRTYSWLMVRDLLVNRFSTTDVRPLIAAQHRRLQRQETVKDYFKDKMILLRQSGISDLDMAAQLTEGMPHNYKQTLIGSQPKTLIEWLTIASQLEAANTTRPNLLSSPASSRPPPRRPPNVLFTKGKPRQQSQPATSAQQAQVPYPCKFCKQKGRTEWHFHRDCPLQQTVPPPPPQSSHDQDDQATSPDGTTYVTTMASTKLKDDVDDFIRIKPLMNGKPIVAILDSCSTCNITNPWIVKEYKCQIIPNTSVKIKMAKGSTSTLGIIRFKMQVGNLTRTIEAHVLDGFPYTMLLGINNRNQFPFVLDFTKQKAFLRKPDDSLMSLVTVVEPTIPKPSPVSTKHNQFETIAEQYPMLFAKNDTDLGKISIEKHRIRLTTDKPISIRPYRQSLARQRETTRQIKGLLTKGLIRESKSPYASPITLVDKKGGTKRLCIDYRELNKITVSDKMPIPRIRDVIDELQGATIFTKLDVASGFWHVEMHPDDTEKTAFVTADGHYEWRVLPFGLKNSPATFQRVIQKVLGDLLHKGTIVYIDDIICYSKTAAEHEALLHKVFQRLKAHYIKLRHDKCSFGMKETEYLGVFIGYNSVCASPTKVQAITEFPRPTEIVSLQRFLGLAGYLRSFIDQFSTKAAPLTKITRKNNPFVWGPEQQAAFETLKTAITSAPVLSIFDPDKPVEIHTDASKIGVGAVLLQNKHPIAFYSRRLNSQEENYSASELECLAVINAIEHFDVYLDGTEFRVVTDHSSLQWLFNFKNPKSRLYRWSIRLSAYSFVVVHRQGSLQTHVDALSRAPLTTLLSIPEITEHQSQTLGKFEFKDNDIVYRKTKGIKRIVVPPQLVVKLLSEAHDQLGHPGINKCITMIRRKYFWPTLVRDVKEYVQSCHPCQLVKSSNHQPYGHLKPLKSPSKPMKLLGIDTIVMGTVARNTKAKFIQVVIDHHSRYVWAIATPTNSTGAAISVLQKVFSECPPTLETRLISDHGTNFMSKDFDKFLKNHNVRHSLSTTYHPQTNGSVEKVNHTIITKLKIEQNLKPNRKWSTLLPDVIQSYNRTIHSVTGFTPEFLLNGNNPEQTDLALPDARKMSQQRTEEFKSKKKAVYDRSHKLITFKVNDLVKRLIPHNDPRNNKLSPKYEAIYKVIAVNPPLNYTIQKLDDPTKKISIHVINLEPYFSRTSALSGRGE